MATNNGMCGSMRGFGIIEPIFACESNMDKLARVLGMDGAELRRKNAIAEGDQWTSRQWQDRPAPVAELIDRCQAMPLPPELSSQAAPVLPGGPATPSRPQDIRRGISISAAAKNTCFSEGCPVNATAMITLQNGVVTIDCAAAEVGQGFNTTAIQIAQTTLGISQVSLAGCDTGMAPAASTDAQMQTVTSGSAVHVAAAKLKERFLAFVGREYGHDPSTLDMRDDHVVTTDGKVLMSVNEAGMGLVFRATERFDQRKTRPVDEVENPLPTHVSITFCANRCVADVDVELGLVRVVQMDVALDIGCLVNPAQAHGQIAGGSLMGHGFALMESCDYEQARPVNANFQTYILPSMADAPVVNCEFLSNPEPGIPYGFRGIGEIPHVQAPAAILSAVRAATGSDLPTAPATPERIALAQSEAPVMRLNDVGRTELDQTGQVNIGKFLRFQLVKE